MDIGAARPPRRLLVGFADRRLRPSARRLARQAQAIGAYDRVVIMDERDLEPTFRARYRQQLHAGSRGFGYWVWKPQVLRQVVATCADGDLIHYVDVGCHLHAPGRARLEEYFAMAASAESGMVAFAFSLPEGLTVRQWHKRPPSALIERHWTKGDLLDHFGVRHRPEIVATPQVISGNFFLRCGPTTRELLDRWASVGSHDFTLLDDSPSRSGNLEGFTEHRHDQSVFSILCKLYGVPTLSAVECEYPAPGGGWDWDALAAFPVHARRDLQRTRRTRWMARARHVGQRVMHRMARLAARVSRPDGA